jgi:hypothetical protein
MSDTVFNISKDGYDANTRNLNNLVASSLGTQLKIIKQGQGSLTIPSADFDKTVKLHHGLAYEPSFITYFEYPDDLERWWIAGTDLGNLGLSDYDSESRVDKEHIIFYGSRGESAEVGDKTMDYAYLLFDQPAAYIAGGKDEPVGFTHQDIGLIVSQAGINANVAPLYKQQFNSETDYLKYHLTKDGNIAYNNTSNGASTTTITHNLGYVPVFMMYGSTDDTVFSFYSAAPQGKVPVPFVASAGASKTNITINLVWAGSFSPDNFNFKYRVVVFKNRMVI